MNEKDLLLSNDDTGRDLNDLQMLRRRHQAIERELTPVVERIEKLNRMATAAAQSSPHDSRHVQLRVSDINSIWEKLKVKDATRKTQLDNAHQMHSFMADSRDLVSSHFTFHTVLLCHFCFLLPEAWMVVRGVCIASIGRVASKYARSRGSGANSSRTENRDC